MKLRAVLCGLVIGLMFHVDWHLARPTHHRLSFGLPYHWAVTALVLAMLGWFIARRWPTERWTIGGWGLLIGLLTPVIEAAWFDHRLGFPSEPGRMNAFWLAIVVSIPAFILALYFGARPSDAMVSNTTTSAST